MQLCYWNYNVYDFSCTQFRIFQKFILPPPRFELRSPCLPGSHAACVLSCSTWQIRLILRFKCFKTWLMEKMAKSVRLSKFGVSPFDLHALLLRWIMVWPRSKYILFISSWEERLEGWSFFKSSRKTLVVLSYDQPLIILAGIFPSEVDSALELVGTKLEWEGIGGKQADFRI